MKRFLPVMIALSVCAHIWSHDSDKAYFLIDFNSSQKHIVVEAEVPWTLRQAMFKDLDEDSNAYISYYGKNQFEYDEIMHYYLRKNFYFLKQTGDTVFMEMYKAGKKKEYSHGGELELHFLDYQVVSVHNSLFINLKPKHQNIVKIIYQDQEDSLIMDASRVDYAFKFASEKDKEENNKKDASEMAFWLLIGMIPILIVLFLMFRKKF